MKNNNTYKTTVFQAPTQKESGIVEWRSPSNIALIKYWGKLGNQIPMNPSLSMTLKYAFTQTELKWEPKTDKTPISFDFYLSKQKVNKAFEKRIENLIATMSADFPKLTNYHITINSLNTFPHSTGIASSASGMSALALSLLSMAMHTHEQELPFSQFLQTASHYARLGSGSASRSIYGPYAIWGTNTSINSVNEYAIPFEPHPEFKKIYNSIMVFSNEPKETGSSEGHSLMKEHHFRQGRIEQSRTNIEVLIKALKTGDFETWQRVTEQEALTLHALMMSSEKPIILLKPTSLEFLQDFIQFRKGKALKAAFTIDAGPNIHVLYAEEHQEIMQSFISDWITSRKLPINVIDDETGIGAKQLF